MSIVTLTATLALGSLLLPVTDVYQHRRLITAETTFSALLTQVDLQTNPILREFKSILQLSSAIFAPNASPGHTIYALIYGHIQTNDHSFALSVERHSPASTTVNAMRVCTRVRRSLFAGVTSPGAGSGVVAVGLLVQML